MPAATATFCTKAGGKVYPFPGSSSGDIQLLGGVKRNSTIYLNTFIPVTMSGTILGRCHFISSHCMVGVV